MPYTSYVSLFCIIYFATSKSPSPNIIHNFSRWLGTGMVWRFWEEVKADWYIHNTTTVEIIWHAQHLHLSFCRNRRGRRCSSANSSLNAREGTQCTQNTSSGHNDHCQILIKAITTVSSSPSWLVSSQDYGNYSCTGHNKLGSSSASLLVTGR